MANEEMQRTMGFVVNQQARFSEGMEQLRESHAQAEKRISNLETAFVGLAGIMTDIGKAQQALAERVTQLAADIAELREAQAHTDQRVNALIDIIERWRNGESKS